MKITITIDTSDAALAHECDHDDCGVKFDVVEMRRILSGFANDCSDLYWHTPGERKVYDVNGNAIGLLEVRE